MAKILDKFFNRIIEGDLELSEQEKQKMQSAPVFNATLEEDEEHERVDVIMEEADRNDILSHKYPVICLKVPDEENEGEYNYMFFKADVYNEHSNGLQYCLWLGEVKEDDNTKSITKLELSFVWDGDEAKTVWEEQAFPIGAGGTQLYKHVITSSGMGNLNIITTKSTAYTGWAGIATPGSFISAYFSGPSTLYTVVVVSSLGKAYGYISNGTLSNVEMGTFESDSVTAL